MNHCEKMKLLLSSLLLCSLCTPSSWSVSPDMMVLSQTPDVSVLEGETVNISCCWMKKIERMRVSWLKNQTVIKTEVAISHSHQGPVNEQETYCSTLIFPNITRNHSGRYICRINGEIPAFYQAEGNGTTITVTARENNNNKDHRIADDKYPGGLPVSVIIALGVVVPLFLIALICFCSLRRSQAQAARVIYEVPHIDSDSIEMDKHSTGSSRGSSQWCQVPVYESFDYFERVETKESG